MAHGMSWAERYSKSASLGSEAFAISWEREHFQFPYGPSYPGLNCGTLRYGTITPVVRRDGKNRDRGRITRWSAPLDRDTELRSLLPFAEESL